MTADIASSLADIKKRMAHAARTAGRPATTAITLIAVSKQQPEDRINAALAAGMRVFGENRVQEAQTRWANRRGAFPDLRLHLIGPLQTNKAADAVALFDAIHTIDRPRLADALHAEMVKQDRWPDCFIQVNTGEEPQKAGIAPHDLAALITHVRMLPGLRLSGLMCIPPVNDPPGLHFAFLAKLGRDHGLNAFSMGMSDDFEDAVMAGATHIRVGSALFGKRDN